MAEFIDDVADYVISGAGIGGRYASPVSGVSVQVNLRRAPEANGFSADTVVLFTQTGGDSFPFNFKEQQSFQVLVDSETVSGAQSVARSIYDFLHETTAQVIGTHEVLWLRAITPPQAIPTGPTDQRYQFSVNFDALLVLA